MKIYPEMRLRILRSGLQQRLWNGIRFGLEVARLGPTLLATRWEEGWETPIAEWRERLGLTDLRRRPHSRRSWPC